METTAKKILLVEKEMIPSFQFSKQEVLESEEARKHRLRDMNRASTLGNGYRGKVEIIFQTADGIKRRVDTTVWTVDEKYMTLKAGCHIPITSIVDIEFF